MTKSKYSDKQQLEQFVKRVMDLTQCRIVKEGKLSYKYKFSANFETNIAEIVQEIPDEDDLRSFLITFRHFISEKEPIYCL